MRPRFPRLWNSVTSYDAGGLSTRGRASLPPLWSAWRFMRRWPVLPLLILAALLVSAVFAGQVSPHDPYAYNLRAQYTPPAWLPGGGMNHFLGADQQGRDVLSRVIYGTRVSLVIAVAVIAMSATIGTTLGLFSGFFGGLFDELILRFVDLTISIPLLLIAMITTMAFGSSLQLLIIVLGLFSWPGFTRQVRAEVLQLRSAGYVQMAQISGASTLRIFTRHLLPNVVNTVIVLATLLVGSIILTESILSFLGAGVPPPTPAWGSMVADGRNFLINGWWIATFPGAAIVITVLGFNFLGDWLRDYFDPRLRQVR